MRDPRQRPYLIACTAMFAFGMVLGLPGTVLGLPEVAERLDLTLADRGALIAALFVGMFAGSALSGPVVDVVGQRVALVASAALVAACLPLFALASTAVLAGVALGALGLAAAGLNIASNALSSDLFPEERGRRLNGLAIAVGLGGVALPAITAAAAGRVPWPVVIGGGAVVAAAAALAAARTPVPSLPRRDVQVLEVLRRPGLGWYCALVMLGAGAESSLAGWTSTYLVARGFDAAHATWLLSSHWAGLITGRLLFAGRVDRGKAQAIERAAVAGAAGVLVLAAASSTVVLAAAPFVIGLSIALVVPTGLALGGERYPGSAGTLYGVLLTFAQVGGFTLPALIGVTAERAGLRIALMLLVVNGVLTALIARRVARPGS